MKRLILAAAAALVAPCCTLQPLVGHTVDANACTIVFSPTPELAEQTQAAIDDWVQYVDCDMTVGDGGIPVHVSDALTDYLGVTLHRKGPPDATSWEIYRVAVAAKAPGYDYTPTLKHEMAHVLGFHGHATTGIVAPHHQGNDVDPEAVRLVCQRVPCLEDVK